MYRSCAPINPGAVLQSICSPHIGPHSRVGLLKLAECQHGGDRQCSEWPIAKVCICVTNRLIRFFMFCFFLKKSLLIVQHEWSYSGTSGQWGLFVAPTTLMSRILAWNVPKRRNDCPKLKQYWRAAVQTISEIVNVDVPSQAKSCVLWIYLKKLNSQSKTDGSIWFWAPAGQEDGSIKINLTHVREKASGTATVASKFCSISPPLCTQEQKKLV